MASSCEWIGVCLDGISGNVVILHKFVKFLEFLITPIFPVIYSKTIFSVSRKHTYWYFINFYYYQITMYVDYLTKLLNQRSYKTYLENVSFPVVILLFDVDNFKSINDNLGHVFGDTVLSFVGKTIKEVYSNYGYCYRIGGDEFCVILTKYDSVKELNNVFTDKLDKMRQSEPNLPYVSVGSAYFEPGYQDISDAVKLADENLYLQKSKLKSERESKP